MRIFKVYIALFFSQICLIYNWTCIQQAELVHVCVLRFDFIISPYLFWFQLNISVRAFLLYFQNFASKSTGSFGLLMNKVICSSKKYILDRN